MSREADIFLPAEKGYVVLDVESQGYARFVRSKFPRSALLLTDSALTRTVPLCARGWRGCLVTSLI